MAEDRLSLIVLVLSGFNFEFEFDERCSHYLVLDMLTHKLDYFHLK